MWSSESEILIIRESRFKKSESFEPVEFCSLTKTEYRISYNNPDESYTQARGAEARAQNPNSEHNENEIKKWMKKKFVQCAQPREREKNWKNWRESYTITKRHWLRAESLIILDITQKLWMLFFFLLIFMSSKNKCRVLMIVYLCRKLLKRINIE